MKDDVRTVLDRVLHWTPERQEDAAELLKLIEEHDPSPYRLTGEQAAEVRRRLAKQRPKNLTLAQLDERLRLLGV